MVVGINEPENIRLKDLLKLVRNKNNKQYSFTIKKRKMINNNVTPNDILNMKIKKYREVENDRPTNNNNINYND